ncbi:coiled-coil domain-containing protein 58 [Galendromus occidentalis]|uniref:Protein MIX23 n=1 Tax=Galendromus occidentalis TaxID=34638 RepID=A0AAJ6VZK9_9ACAR|nr:coiled-coil domain-containing protein 58 [Galendromus occidentalis]
MDSATTACDDILAFEELLKNSRKLDDNIIHALNTTIPTQSFVGEKDATKTCKDLHAQLEDVSTSRRKAIQGCIEISEGRVQELRTAKNKSPDDVNVLKALRKEQTKFRLLQSELGVEEVIRSRTYKAFHERCRWYYNP